MEEDRRACCKCKVKLPLEHYEKKRSGDYFKQCNQCREKGRLNAQKNKCEHNRKKCECKECGGSRICEHNRSRTRCKECGGRSICEHNRIKSVCKECGGGSICDHNRSRTRCKECGGGTICNHNKIRNICKECGGGSICEHNKRKSFCKECDEKGHLSNIVRSRVHNALRQEKKDHSIEYLGCTIEEFKQHIESQFKENMSWDNYGEWHIDHITPLKYENPTIEQVIERLHYKNTQPLWASENLSKRNRFIG